jgi:tRNA (guanosine-2'-O-)-methyltransferase
MTPARKKKIEEVLSKRQPDLAVVLENVDDPHNVGAILRSCDAFGVLDVHLLYPKGKMPRMFDLRSKAAASAVGWLRIHKWHSLAGLVRHLKKQKMALAVTVLSDRTEDPAKMDLAKPLAIAIGNEHSGATPALLKAAKIHLKIPMVGFVQSFNVSVATALVLYEAFRQREKKGMYQASRLKAGERKKILKEWGA